MRLKRTKAYLFGTESKNLMYERFKLPFFSFGHRIRRLKLDASMFVA